MIRFALLAMAALALVAQQTKQGAEKLAPYYPTPLSIVEKMLDLGGLKAGEKMFDLGSGDGRLVIMAAQKHRADATGVELDRDLYLQSTQRIKELSLTNSARVINGDILQQDYGSADLVTVYLLPSSNERVRPVLEAQLKPGTRVVCHDFEIPGWTPVRTEHIDDDGEGRSHTLYLYRR